MTFDTLKYAETLREAGIDEKQASAQAHALNHAITNNIATKHNLTMLRQFLATNSH